MGRSVQRKKLKKLNDDVTLDVITHFIKQLKKDYSGYPEIKTYLTELQQDIVEKRRYFSWSKVPSKVKSLRHRWIRNSLVDTKLTY
ncbi:AAA family ATPase [Vibrio sinaloensis]|nr:AAA family ATPase [Vibrio sinaloensis]